MHGEQPQRPTPVKPNFSFEYAGQRITADMVWQFDQVQDTSDLVAPVRALLLGDENRDDWFVIVGISRKTGALNRVMVPVSKVDPAWCALEQLILS